MAALERGRRGLLPRPVCADVRSGLADGRGRAVIYNDDPTSTATLSVDDVTVTEGNAGTTTQAVFNVSLSRPSAGPVSVRVVTIGGTAHVHANDFVHVDQIITFARDETTKQVAVTVNGEAPPPTPLRQRRSRGLPGDALSSL